MEQKNFQQPIFIMLLLFTVTVFGVLLKLANSFFLPIVIAVLLTFVFYPFCKKLHQCKIPWPLCIIIIFVTAIIVMYIVGNLLVSSTITILSAYPKYEKRFMNIYQLICESLNLDYDADQSLFRNLWNSINLRNYIQNTALSLSGQIVSVVKLLLIIGLLMIFLLLEVRSLKIKLQDAFTSSELRSKIVHIVYSTISQVTHYISIKFMISLLTGFLVWIATFIVKMDFPIIWGFIAFVLNFIPNFGSIISWGITTLFAVLQFYPQWGIIVYVSVSVLAINMVLGNFVEPRWEGSDLGISPFAILVSLSFWGWMWGFIGMVLAVPLTVIIKIICENVTILKPVAVILGNRKADSRKKETETSPAKVNETAETK